MKPAIKNLMEKLKHQSAIIATGELEAAKLEERIMEQVASELNIADHTRLVMPYIHDCPTSPSGTCVYDDEAEDYEDCIICGDPRVRK